MFLISYLKKIKFTFIKIICTLPRSIISFIRALNLMNQPNRLLCPWDFVGKILEWVAQSLNTYNEK